MSGSDLEYLIATASKRYKVYGIPKKSGGLRTIAHPARELKTLQRALIARSPKKLQVHQCATAYEQGTSILLNASQHAQNPWIANLDFSNFFNSISTGSWCEYLQSLDVEEEYTDISSNVFFWRPKRANTSILSVGAPSSPFVSNRIMFEFDTKASEYFAQQGVKYTRYADDMTFSGKEKFDLPELEKRVCDFLPPYLKLEINGLKSRQAGPGSRKLVTGLVVTDDGKVTLGKRLRKRIEAYVDKYSTGKHYDVTKEKILGYLAFLRHVEPEAYEKIRNKYSGKAKDLFSEDKK